MKSLMLTTPSRGPIARALKHAWNGVASGYPWCCVAAFTWVCATRHDFPPRVLGGRNDRGGYVPCGVLHRPHVRWDGEQFVETGR